MPEPIQNYAPQPLIAVQKRYAYFAWAIALSVVFIWLGFIVGAPIAKAAGMSDFADSVYKFFSYVCHQIPSRSFHIFEHKFAVCSRCFGFYGGFLSGFIAYPLFRAVNDIESFPRFWLFLALIPIGIDWALGVFGIWDNNFVSRSVTGAILGFTCAIFIVPALAEIGLFAAERKMKRLSG